jgi:hypothetical protein
MIGIYNPYPPFQPPHPDSKADSNKKGGVPEKEISKEQTSVDKESLIQELMKKTGDSYESASHIIEERELYIQMMMEKGATRKEAEKQVDSVY